MSFSSQVKEEMAAQSAGAGHCRAAELSAILTFCGGVRISGRDEVSVRVVTENLPAAQRFCVLVRTGFHVIPQVRVSVRQGGGHRLCCVQVTDQKEALRLLDAAGILDENLMPPPGAENGLLLPERTCCRRAYLRGVFLAAGSLSDPRKSYHLEMVTPEKEKAEHILSLLGDFGLEGRIVVRKRRYVVYLKEGDQISDFLKVTEAHRALLEFENIRVLREISNTVNRKVNCEAANIGKTVLASVRQRTDIRLVLRCMGEETLPGPLRETAILRLENPDLPLKDLGALHNPPVGKSGVNHRLRRLEALAASLRAKGEEDGPEDEN